MMVTGPGSQAGVPGAAPDATSAPDAVKGKAGTTGAEKPEGASRSFAETLAADRPAPEAAAARAGGADPLTSDIAADLQAGKIDPKAALDRVVERVLARQLGADAPATLRSQLRDALRDTISSDPFIAERLRGLG
ncbi:MAG TPA: hypothetical protein VMT47_19245 [Polyangia bacterium]|nr:hypothetical protein [Polyangia bacterium]